MAQKSSNTMVQMQVSEVEVDPTVDLSELSPVEALASTKEGFGVARPGIQKAPRMKKTAKETTRGINAVVAELERPT